MLFMNPNRALLQGMMAGALVLASTSACSRPDRTESGSDESAALMQDTVTTAPGTHTGMDTMAPGRHTGMDTAAALDTTRESGAVTGDTAPAQIQSDAPRSATAPPSAELQDTSLQADTAAAGYRPMERDTATVPESDSARVTDDTSDVSVDTSVSSADTAAVELAGAAWVSDSASVSVGVDTTVDTSMTISDTIEANAGVSDTAWTEMARDTSTTADQIDTTGAAVGGEVAVETTADTGAAVSGDVALEARVDTSDNDGRIRPPEDSTEIVGEVTTNTTAELATADTIESDRIRPPEDSTELHGNAISDETADEREISAEDREVVSASDSRTDEVGAAAIAVAGNVTGSEAAALVTRQGAACIVVDPETSEEVRWDMSSTPVTLNPCGLGSMNLSTVWTAGQRGSRAAGQ